MCNRAHTQEEYDAAVARFAKKKWISVQHPSVAKIDGCGDVDSEGTPPEDISEGWNDLEREPHDHDKFILIWDVDFRKNFCYYNKKFC